MVFWDYFTSAVLRFDIRVTGDATNQREPGDNDTDFERIIIISTMFLKNYKIVRLFYIFELAIIQYLNSHMLGFTIPGDSYLI